MITAKIIGLVLLTILSTGAFFPEQLKKYRAVSVAVILMALTSTYFLVNSLLSDASSQEKASETSRAIQAVRAPKLVNFVSAIEALAIPKDAQWTYRAWNGLVNLAPWVEPAVDNETGQEYPLFQSCEHFDRRGHAKFRFANVSPLDWDGREVVAWSVSTCGPRAGLSKISFGSNHTSNLDGIFEGLKIDFLSDGYTIEYLGCDGLRSEPFSFYKISRPDIKPFILETHYFSNVSSANAEITIYFQDLDVNLCDRRIDILNLDR